MLETPTQVFSCEIFKIFKSIFFYRTLLLASVGGRRVANDAIPKSTRCRAIVQESLQISSWLSQQKFVSNCKNPQKTQKKKEERKKHKKYKNKEKRANKMKKNAFRTWVNWTYLWRFFKNIYLNKINCWIILEQFILSVVEFINQLLNTKRT